MSSRIECTLEFIRMCVGLPETCQLVGITVDDGTGVATLHIEGGIGMPSVLHPVFTLHETKREELSPVVGRITGHWRHEPDVEWTSGRFFDFGKVFA